MRNAMVIILFVAVALVHAKDSTDKSVEKFSGPALKLRRLNRTDLDNTKLSSLRSTSLTVRPFDRADVDRTTLFLAGSLKSQVEELWERYREPLQKWWAGYPRWAKAVTIGSAVHWSLYFASYVPKLMSNAMVSPIFESVLELVAGLNEASQGLVAAMNSVVTNYMVIISLSKMNPDLYEKLMTTYVYANLAAAVFSAAYPVVARLMENIQRSKLEKMLKEAQAAKVKAAKDAQAAQESARAAQDKPGSKKFATPTGEDVCEGKGFDKTQCEGLEFCCVWDDNKCMSAIGQRPCWYYPSGEDVCEGHDLNQKQCEDREQCCVWDGTNCRSGIGQHVCWFYDINGHASQLDPPAGFAFPKT